MIPRDATATPHPSHAPTPPIDVEQAEALLIEHYRRLVRIAYLVLPPGLGRNRRVLTAHAVTQRALPHGRTTGPAPAIPPQRAAEAGYAFLRLRVLRAALDAGRPRRLWALPRRSHLPVLFPHVWGLRLFPRAGGADELALDQALSALSGPARAAYVLRGLERLPDGEVVRILQAAGVADVRAALAEADAVVEPTGSRDRRLLESPEFDACSLQARPTDLMRRRQHLRAAVVATAAVLVCGTLLGLPGEGWGPNGAAAPTYARNPAAERALEPAALTRAAPTAWRNADRTDFSAWPARGNRTGDRALLRRALAVWARPGRNVRVTATPGTAPGPAPGPAQLLYAGEVDATVVVLLYDGLRVVRYAEARDGAGGGAALDFARTDGADAASATALVVDRADRNVHYLTAPWVSGAYVRDLLRPSAPGRPLHRRADGVTEPVPSPAGIVERAAPAAGRGCGSWPALELRAEPEALGRGGDARVLVTDLGELAPARLTYGDPARGPRDVAGHEARAVWARTACHLPEVRSLGVRSVNSWEFARQPLPADGGRAAWVCTRAETWRGEGSRVLAQFQPPVARASTPGAVAARAESTPVCGPRAPWVLTGVLWKSGAGRWYVLAAGSHDVASIQATGGVRGRARGHLLAVRAAAGARAELDARTADGTRLPALH